jgi:hypothetical protein
MPESIVGKMLVACEYSGIVRNEFIKKELR